MKEHYSVRKTHCERDIYKQKFILELKIINENMIAQAVFKFLNKPKNIALYACYCSCKQNENFDKIKNHLKIHSNIEYLKYGVNFYSRKISNNLRKYTQKV